MKMMLRLNLLSMMAYRNYLPSPPTRSSLGLGYLAYLDASYRAYLDLLAYLK
jgi:hypothetical protein